MSWLTTRSSSYHTLDTYQGLSHVKKVIYLGLNYLNTILPRPWLKQPFTVRPFTLAHPEPLLSFLQPSDSPSRKLSNLFWMSLPWKEIRAQLGDIHAFDIGCGAGNYGPFLEEHSGKRLASYTGIDVEEGPLWQKLVQERPDFFRFHRFQGKDIRPFFSEKTNLIVSQSALEHIPEDIVFFEQLQGFIEARQTPTIQIHLMPAAASTSLYPFHGIRQYTPDTVARLLNCFNPDKTTFELYALGSTHSIAVHKRYIADSVFRKSIDRRKAAPDAYAEESTLAVCQDLKTQDASHASFYALIIQSYCPTRLPPVST